MPQRTFGTVSLVKNAWQIDAAPHVLIRLKQVFTKLPKTAGKVSIANTPENCRDLEWFIQRFPLVLEDGGQITAGADTHRERLERLESFAKPDYQPSHYGTAYPPRAYQAQAIDIWRANGFMLLGDEMGLGKTASFTCALIHPEMRPALVVCDAHLPPQWTRELVKFIPGLRTHVIKQRGIYDLPPADVYVCSYAKLSSWAEIFRVPGFIKTVCYDEIQALRHNKTEKHKGARQISASVEWAIGLSGTPIYGYGEEIYNVFEALRPGLFGDYNEFCREWLEPGPGGKWKFKDSRAFGSYLKDNFYGLARTRQDVGRELPPLTKIPYTIAFDAKVMDGVKDSATALARQILSESSTFMEKGQAAREFDLKVRQATGISKAPAAAAFIKMLIESGKRPVCFAWHREVYRIMAKELEEYSPVFYTGEESPAKKEAAVQDFISGKAKVIFLSTRSGAGLNGLQDVSDTTVHVELDWAPAVHDQNICRVFRDKSDGTYNTNVFSYFLLSDSGSDPVMAQILNLKSTEINGLMRPDEDPATVKIPEIDPERIKQMALAYLNSH